MKKMLAFVAAVLFCGMSFAVTSPDYSGGVPADQTDDFHGGGGVSPDDDHGGGVSADETDDIHGSGGVPADTPTPLPDGGPYKETVDGIEWTFMVKNGEASVTGANPASGAIVIPSTLGDCPVTSIGDFAFDGCSGLTSVTIPSCVTSIGSYAFQCCSGLTSMTIPEGVTNIGSYAFPGCSSLTSVTISSSVTSIGKGAFSVCSGLTSIEIPLSVTSIGEGAFSECNGLVEIVVAAGNGRYTSENGVLFNKSKTEIAAYPCGKSGQHYTIPNGVTSIGSYAFRCCRGLTSVEIPNSVTSIGGWAFQCCRGLTSVEIPNSVTSIGHMAFEGCRGLTSVTIPSSVTSIGEGCFSGCSGLMEIFVDTANTNYKSENGLLLSKDGMRLILGVNGAVTIPNSVTSIGNHAFYDCSGLTNVTMSSSVTNIERCAFYICSGLRSVAIPSSVASIGSSAFHACFNLDAVDFEGAPPEGVAEADINQDAAIRYNIAYEDEWMPVIEECGWTNATPYDVNFSGTLPDGVMREVVDGVVWYYSHPISGSSYSGTVRLNEAMIGFGTYPYQPHINAISSNTVGAVVIPSVLGGLPVTTIAPQAFSGCKYVTSIEIPPSVQNIGDSAFEGCSSLLSVTFKGDVPDRVDNDAFSGTSKRLVVSVPYGSIGWNDSVTTPLPEAWYGRAIVHEGEIYDWDAGHGTSAGGQGLGIVTAVNLTVTNVVVHYVLNSVQPEIAVPVSGDTGFTTVITEVKSAGAVSVPSEWKENYPNFTTKYGNDFGKALMRPTGKKDGAGNDMFVWQDYVAGTDPTNPDDKFTASITMVDGVPVISYTPELSDEQKALREYKTFGKKQLQDNDWTDITNLDGEAKKPYNFFKVTVEMR